MEKRDKRSLDAIVQALGLANSTEELLKSGQKAPSEPQVLPEKVVRLSITRELNWLYRVDSKGDVWRSATPRDGRPAELVARGVPREDGYVYFVDKEGDVSRIPTPRRLQ